MRDHAECSAPQGGAMGVKLLDSKDYYGDEIRYIRGGQVIGSAKARLGGGKRMFNIGRKGAGGQRQYYTSEGMTEAWAGSSQV